MSRKSNWKSWRPERELRVRVKWVRTPIGIPRGRSLRVLIYARFSSDEQKRRSIKAQIEFCKKFLKELNIINVTIIVITDEGISGERRSRPGIDRVWAGIRERAWDVVLIEDASRLYRDEVPCLDLVRLAVDMGIRTLCIGDFMDTAEPDWQERLKEAARYHAASNRYGSQRIKRAHEELWDAGAAIGLLKTGYLRVPSVPAAKGEPAEGPFFDHVDPVWAPIIKEAFERIAAGERPWSVASWLTLVGLPKARNSRYKDWRAKSVVELIRRPDYRGFQNFRHCVSKKEYSTGKYKPTPNDPEEILSRAMPHLRIVEDWLWQQANAAIDARRLNPEVPRGSGSPLYGIPRDSRGPLSGLFSCGRCRAKMHVGGRIDGGYRCSAAHRGACWNKATARRDETHARISGAIIRALESLHSRLDRLLADAERLLDDSGQRDARIERLQAKKTKLERAQANLGRAVELGERSPAILVAKLDKCEERMARIGAQLERLNRRETLCVPPTREEIDIRIQKLIGALNRMDRTARDDLKSLVGQIVAVPCRQSGCDQVVLRAKFGLRLASLLPARTQAALVGLLPGAIEDQFETVPLTIDLFKSSAGPQYGLAALALQESEQLSLTAIGKRLGISRRQADIAIQYGRSLRNATLTDPYVELTEPPVAASRWRRRLPK